VKQRLFPALLFSGLILASCGGGDTAAATCKEYWFTAEQIGACLPDNWNVLDRAALDGRGAPQDVVIAFQLKDAVSGQFPTVSVTREPLATVVDPVSYSDATMRSVSVLPNYKFIDKRTVSITATGGKSLSLPIHIFSAQPVAGEPQRRFSQLSLVVEKSGYTVTALTPLSVESTLEAAVLKILESVTFTAPEETKKK